MSVVLDTSAVLASLWSEPGADRVDQVIGEACISAVNLSELIAKLVDRGASDDQIEDVLLALNLEVESFSAGQARLSGILRRQTRSLGLSLGDRCCLALAQEINAPVLTADRAWVTLDIGIEIEVIR